MSFSKGWRNPVLWSHYAVGGKGIALGLDIKRTLGIRGALEVKYEDDKLKALGDDSISKEFQELLRVTKFRHWAYEEELRVFVELSTATKEDGRHFYPFGADLSLREVILGPLCPASVDTIRTLVQATNPGAVVSKARLGYKYFEVKEDGKYPAQ